MSIFSWLKTPISIINKEIIPALCVRRISLGNPVLCKDEEDEPVEETEHEISKGSEENLDIKTCIAYMRSDAYKKTYGDEPVWHLYVRNFKGPYPPSRTRKNCWKGGKLNTGSPCPICRDQYLLADYRNVKLLKQFISPYGGQILDSQKTGVCQKQQLNLEVAIRKARNYGYLTFTVPPRVYNYSAYKKK